MIRKLVAAAVVAGAAVVGGAGVVDAHFNSAAERGVGGPLGSSATPGDGAQGHWRGLECHAAPNSPVLQDFPGDICVLD